MLARPSTTAMGDFYVIREVLIDETYRDVLPLLHKQAIRLVDIGANLGSFTLWMDRTTGLREAFCFEPEADSFRLLNFNLSLNDCSAAKTLECAVGGEQRTIRMALRKENPAATTIYDHHTSLSAAEAARAVPVVTLENWLREVEGDFDLLKVDCEGAEWEIIRKTDPRIFARFRVIVAEVHDDPENRQTISEFKQGVESLGYRTVRWDNRAQELYVGTREA
jgi:FkbM family methyltransferase